MNLRDLQESECYLKKRTNVGFSRNNRNHWVNVTRPLGNDHSQMLARVVLEKACISRNFGAV